jgi:hypothetical protein
MIVLGVHGSLFAAGAAPTPATLDVTVPTDAQRTFTGVRLLTLGARVSPIWTPRWSAYGRIAYS